MMRGKEREKRRRRVRMRRKRTKVSGAKCSSRISKAVDPCRMVGRRLDLACVLLFEYVMFPLLLPAILTK